MSFTSPKTSINSRSSEEIMSDKARFVIAFGAILGIISGVPKFCADQKYQQNTMRVSRQQLDFEQGQRSVEVKPKEMQ